MLAQAVPGGPPPPRPPDGGRAVRSAQSVSPPRPADRRAPHRARDECSIHVAPSPLHLALSCHLSLPAGPSPPLSSHPRRAGGGRALSVLHNLLVKSVHVALFVSDPPTCSQLCKTPLQNEKVQKQNPPSTHTIKSVRECPTVLTRRPPGYFFNILLSNIKIMSFFLKDGIH